MNYIRKLKKNSKALSPVVASIILIAVTVAVSVVVAAWMGGMTIGLMGNAEQASITNIGFTQATSSASAYLTVAVQNTGTTDVKISTVYIDGNSVAANQTLPWTIAKGASGTVTLTLSGTAPVGLTSGQTYSVKMTSTKGTNLTSYQQLHHKNHTASLKIGNSGVR